MSDEKPKFTLWGDKTLEFSDNSAFNEINRRRAQLMSDERLIFMLRTINPTAIDNDGGKPGSFIALLCSEAADRLEENLDYKPK